MDVDLRKLRYFVAVAERLHFGRAAEELYISQPVLSRQIRALEQELGNQLFDRDNRGVRLTDAGRQLLDDASALLTAAEALRRRVHRAEGPCRLRVGFQPGIVVTSAVREFERIHPGLIVDVQRLEWRDQTATVLDGRIDVGYVRLPVADAGLRVVPLHSEPRVLAVATDHRLADRDSVALADLAAEPVIWDPAPNMLPGSTYGHVVRSIEEKLEHVAAGRAVSPLPTSVAEYYRLPGIRYLPLVGLAPEQTGLITEAVTRSVLIDDFVSIAMETALVA
jgi:DNA-binding transcriptional LysR family regulator